METPPPDPPPSPQRDKPPLLDYRTRPTAPNEPETERWSEVARAAMIVFGIIAFLLFVFYGLCGGLVRGC